MNHVCINAGGLRTRDDDHGPPVVHLRSVLFSSDRREVHNLVLLEALSGKMSQTGIISQFFLIFVVFYREIPLQRIRTVLWSSFYMENVQRRSKDWNNIQLFYRTSILSSQKNVYASTRKFDVFNRWIGYLLHRIIKGKNKRCRISVIFHQVLTHQLQLLTVIQILQRKR